MKFLLDVHFWANFWKLITIFVQGPSGFCSLAVLVDGC